MFTNVQQAIDYAINRKKADHPNSNFKGLLAKYDNPQYKFKSIHVAGTNGKGSTTNYIRAILQAGGYKVGSFTSPHLITHLDRIRINDENIDADYFLDAMNKYYDDFQTFDLTMFEIDTFIAFLYFIDQKVDYAVIEVGLGGRLDPTNVIKPLVGVITNIEYDHMAILGDTIEKIAYEKAGIIKENMNVITFEKKENVLQVFNDKAKEVNGKLTYTLQAKNVIIDKQIQYDYKNYHIAINTIAPYQILNSSAAIEVIDYLNEIGETNINERIINEGLQSQWKGRFEIISEDPRIIIDGAHNDNGIDQLCQAIETLNESVVIVFSALADKTYHEMLGKLLNKGEVIVTHFDNDRSTSAQSLACGYDVEVIADYKKAITYALSKKKTVIITGSLYFISLVREYLC